MSEVADGAWILRPGEGRARMRAEPMTASLKGPVGRIGRKLLLAVVFLPSCISAQPSGTLPTGSPSPTLAATPETSAAPTATPTPTRRLLVTPTPLPTSRPATGLVAHENPLLGYRINLPEALRRSAAGIVAGNEEALGYDLYTARTEAQDREACLSDAGGRPGLDEHPNLNIGASRNPARLSAEAWATTPRFPGAQPLSMHMLVERTTIDGREAVRLVRDQQTNHETTAYVVRANDRIYTLRFESDSIPSRLPGWLDGVAATFRVIQPLPFPTATPPPSVAPRDAARELGRRLSQAFAARDVDALAGLITPQCWIGTWPFRPPGVGVDGSSRAVVPFLDALRASFARDGVAVVVDPELQVHVDGTGAFRNEQFFVRSDWTASGVTMRMDLFLAELDGRQYWVAARFYDVPGAQCSDLPIIFGDPSSIGRCL